MDDYQAIPPHERPKAEREPDDYWYWWTIKAAVAAWSVLCFGAGIIMGVWLI